MRFSFVAALCLLPLAGLAQPSAGGGPGPIPPFTPNYYGADPTGTRDSSVALNAALAQVAPGNSAARRKVSLPAGVYYLQHQLNMSGGVLACDGRDNTTFVIDQTFDVAAVAVLRLTSNSLDPGPEVRDCGFEFAQPLTQTLRANFAALGTCTSGAGGTGCKYPPGILAATNSARYKISGVRMARAWNGISSNGVNAVWWFDDIEMGSLNVGLDLDGTQDFSHLTGFHFWNFDIAQTDPLYGVYTDGNNFAAKIGRMDGFNVRDFTVWRARVQLTATYSWGQFAEVMMDGNGATFEVLGNQWLQISNIYFTGASNNTTNTHCQLDVAGGTQTLVNNLFSTITGAGRSGICVANSNLQITGGRIAVTAADERAVLQTSGAFSSVNVNYIFDGALSYTVPAVDIQAGTVHFHANRFIATAGDVGSVVIATDSVYNSVVGNNFNGWGWVPPAAGLGFYGLNSTRTPVPHPVSTVAALPACVAGLLGSVASVSDALGPAYNAAVVGGGALHIPVFCNGAAWTAH